MGRKGEIIGGEVFIVCIPITNQILIHFSFPIPGFKRYYYDNIIIPKEAH